MLDQRSLTNAMAFSALGVALVLLLTFYVVTPSHRRDEPVLIRATESSKVDSLETDLSIFLHADGKVTVGNLIVNQETLEKELREIQERTPDRRVVVKGDRTVPYERVQAVLRAARDAGYADVILATGPRDVLDSWQNDRREGKRAN